MAERRMFAKSIVLSDAFLDMPLSARCLYFTLGMLADDDGFIGSPKSIMRQCGASQDDMAILLQKRYVLAFESGVIVIKHWRMNNYLQNDRHKATTYLEELETLVVDERGAYTEANKHAFVTQYEDPKPIQDKVVLSDARKLRAQAKKESSLPSTFDNRIRNAFVGHRCPVCGVIMGYDNNLIKPTIQHNLPISCGGKHELDNISVICQSCNTSMQNKVETPPYNTEEVKAVWDCIGNVYTVKDSIGKVSIDKNIYSVHFEEFWKNYPRKKEKAKAYKCYMARLHDGFSEDQLLEACINYAADCDHTKREERYIKLGATFLSSSTPFTDYFDENYTPAKIKPQTSTNSKIHNFEERDYDFDELMRGVGIET